MTTAAEIRADVRAAIQADLPEVTQTITYRDPIGAETSSSAYKVKAKFTESDGESVKIGSAKFIIFTDEIAVVPVIDGWILHGGEEFHISRVVPDSLNVAWRCFTKSF